MEKKGKVLAIDYGKKRVGVASGDLGFRIAFPRDVIENKGIPDLVEKITALAGELFAVLIVIGLPLNMDEKHLENKVMQEVKRFTSELGEKLKDVEIQLLDERLSTFEADKLMKEAKAASKEPFGRDAYAAQVILQRFFDKSVT